MIGYQLLDISSFFKFLVATYINKRGFIPLSDVKLNKFNDILFRLQHIEFSCFYMEKLVINVKNYTYFS